MLSLGGEPLGSVSVNKVIIKSVVLLSECHKFSIQAFWS